MKAKNIISIGTRSSPLALAQAQYVKAKLMAHHPESALTILIKPFETKGDILSQTSQGHMMGALGDEGGKQLFTKELEEALQAYQLDVVVHSLKDVPVRMGEGLMLAGVPERASAQDVLVLAHKWQDKNIHRLSDLPKDFVIGTSSHRRTAQLQYARPDIQVEVLRGNVGTRLSVLDETKGKKNKGGLDAICVAQAGLERLNLLDHVAARQVVMNPPLFLPAPAQGALGLQLRKDNESMKAFLAPLACPQTELCIQAERAFLKQLGGDCRTPLGAKATIQGALISLQAVGFDSKGKRRVFVEDKGDKYKAHLLGIKLAKHMIKQAPYLSKSSI